MSISSQSSPSLHKMFRVRASIIGQAVHSIALTLKSMRVLQGVYRVRETWKVRELKIGQGKSCKVREFIFVVRETFLKYQKMSCLILKNSKFSAPSALFRFITLVCIKSYDLLFVFVYFKMNLLLFRNIVADILF